MAQYDPGMSLEAAVKSLWWTSQVQDKTSMVQSRNYGEHNFQSEDEQPSAAQRVTVQTNAVTLEMMQLK